MYMIQCTRSTTRQCRGMCDCCTTKWHPTLLWHVHNAFYRCSQMYMCVHSLAVHRVPHQKHCNPTPMLTYIYIHVHVCSHITWFAANDTPGMQLTTKWFLMVSCSTTIVDSTCIEHGTWPAECTLTCTWNYAQHTHTHTHTHTMYVPTYM